MEMLFALLLALWMDGTGIGENPTSSPDVVAQDGGSGPPPPPPPPPGEGDGNP